LEFLHRIFAVETRSANLRQVRTKQLEQCLYAARVTAPRCCVHWGPAGAVLECQASKARLALRNHAQAALVPAFGRQVRRGVANAIGREQVFDWERG
jgi:hypothetical protein